MLTLFKLITYLLTLNNLNLNIGYGLSELWSFQETSFLCLESVLGTAFAILNAAAIEHFIQAPGVPT